MQWPRQSNHLYHLLVRTSGGPADCRSSILNPEFSIGGSGLLGLFHDGGNHCAMWCAGEDGMAAGKRWHCPMTVNVKCNNFVFYYYYIFLAFALRRFSQRDGGADAESVETFARHLQILLILLSFGGFLAGHLKRDCSDDMAAEIWSNNDRWTPWQWDNSVFSKVWVVILRPLPIQFDI